SESVDSAPNAVSKLYQSIFHSNSKFSGSLMLDHNKKSIIQELLWNISVYSFKIEYNKHQIWIHSLGTSENPDFLGAELGYSSLFLYFYTKNKKKQCVLIWQTVDKNGCHIEIYCNNELLDKFYDKTPSTI
ncbi:12509_t:CDS:1, partial [Gigaspora margarita]